MKTLISILFIFSICLEAQSQVYLRGTVERSSSPIDSFAVNIPKIYGFFKENNHWIHIDKRNQFSDTINIEVEKFAKLEWGNRSYTLLLQPRTTIEFQIDSSSGKISFSKDSTGLVNSVLAQLELDSIPVFNGIAGKEENEYSKLPVSQINEKVVIPWLHHREKLKGFVEKSQLSDRFKQLFRSELTYYHHNQLNWYLRGVVRLNRKDLSNFLVAYTDSISPEPETAIPGSQYYYFADNYIGYLEANSFLFYQSNKLSSKDPLPYYNFSIDSGNNLVKTRGKAYMNWIAVRNNFKNAFGEAFLVQNIDRAIYDKDLKVISSLLPELQREYPLNSDLNTLTKRKDSLLALLEQQLKNDEIIVYDNYKSVKSIMDVVTQYKGKVVYLDIWGTWCGPCKEEFNYLPSLKQRFKGKDIVFLYLDMDDDDKDSEWRDFIFLHNLTGVHLRKNNQEIKSIWMELIPEQSEKRVLYPSYFLFDKEGKAVTTNVYRPSDKNLLYQQIEILLQ